MAEVPDKRRSWKEALKSETPLLLPVAHDALTAKLIELAGYAAYQVGGFAVDGTRYGLPDIDLTRFGEKSEAFREIISASSLPVLVDADDGYGDVKNVTYTVGHYEVMGASAIFLEDQVSPKRCGHMAGKQVVPKEHMVAKLRAAAEARIHPETLFLLARTDAIQPEGLDEALRRGTLYLKNGADGIYVEGPTSIRELERIGKEFKGMPLATSILENGGVTPWASPKEMGAMGFSMILYPTTVLFQVTSVIQQALKNLRAGEPMKEDAGVTMKKFEEILGLEKWKKIEKRFQP